MQVTEKNIIYYYLLCTVIFETNILDNITPIFLKSKATLPIDFAVKLV